MMNENVVGNSMDGRLELLYPMNRFYAQFKLPLPWVAQMDSKDIPEPYQQLLVHNNDMTPTLEAYHGEMVHLRVLARRLERETLFRMVTLELNGSKRPVEFGAICIHLSSFPPAAKEQALESKLPLGTILAYHHIPRISCPRAFFWVMSDATMNAALGLTESHRLYGRHNVLLTPGGETIADIVEILPLLTQ